MSDRETRKQQLVSSLRSLSRDPVVSNIISRYDHLDDTSSTSGSDVDGAPVGSQQWLRQHRQALEAAEHERWKRNTEMERRVAESQAEHEKWRSIETTPKRIALEQLLAGEASFVKAEEERAIFENVRETIKQTLSKTVPNSGGPSGREKSAIPQLTPLKLTAAGKSGGSRPSSRPGTPPPHGRDRAYSQQSRADDISIARSLIAGSLAPVSKSSPSPVPAMPSMPPGAGSASPGRSAEDIYKAKQLEIGLQLEQLESTQRAVEGMRHADSDHRRAELVEAIHQRERQILLLERTLKEEAMQNEMEKQRVAEEQLMKQNMSERRIAALRTQLTEVTSKAESERQHVTEFVQSRLRYLKNELDVYHTRFDDRAKERSKRFTETMEQLCVKAEVEVRRAANDEEVVKVLHEIPKIDADVRDAVVREIGFRREELITRLKQEICVREAEMVREAVVVGTTDLVKGPHSLSMKDDIIEELHDRLDRTMGERLRSHWAARAQVIESQVLECIADGDTRNEMKAMEVAKHATEDGPSTAAEVSRMGSTLRTLDEEIQRNVVQKDKRVVQAHEASKKMLRKVETVEKRILSERAVAEKLAKQLYEEREMVRKKYKLTLGEEQSESDGGGDSE